MLCVLQRHGLRVYARDPYSFTPLLEDGQARRSLLLGHDMADTQRQIAQFSSKDAQVPRAAGGAWGWAPSPANPSVSGPKGPKSQACSHDGLDLPVGLVWECSLQPPGRSPSQRQSRDLDPFPPQPANSWARPSSNAQGQGAEDGQCLHSA